MYALLNDARNSRVELSTQLENKQSSYDALEKQNKSLEHYVIFLKNLAASRGLGGLSEANNNNPAFAKFASDNRVDVPLLPIFPNNTKSAPEVKAATVPTSLQTYAITINSHSSRFSPPIENEISNRDEEAEPAFIDLQSIVLSSKESLYDRIPSYAKKLLESTSPRPNRDSAAIINQRNNDESKPESLHSKPIMAVSVPEGEGSIHCARLFTADVTLRLVPATDSQGKAIYDYSPMNSSTPADEWARGPETRSLARTMALKTQAIKRAKMASASPDPSATATSERMELLEPQDVLDTPAVRAKPTLATATPMSQPRIIARSLEDVMSTPPPVVGATASSMGRSLSRPTPPRRAPPPPPL